jgi:subtilisin family serine protease
MTPDRYGIGAGTSFATPIVAGIVAALLAANPDLTAADIRSQIPNWTGPNQRLDTLVALVSAGIMTPEQVAEADLGDGISAIYPYEVAWAFREGHPYRHIQRSLEALAPLDPEVRVSYGWSFNPSPANWSDAGWDKDIAVYGLVTGIIALFGDGTAAATATWRTDRQASRSGLSAVYGRFGSFDGHQVWCGPTPLTEPAAVRARAWEIPVTAAAEVIRPGTGDTDPPEVRLTLALGEGATVAGAPGQLPEPVTIWDTWDQCAQQIHTAWDDWSSASDAATAAQQWAHLQAFEKKFFALAEQASTFMVENGPYSADLRLIHTPGAAAGQSPVNGDDRMLFRYWTGTQATWPRR